MKPLDCPLFAGESARGRASIRGSHLADRVAEQVDASVWAPCPGYNSHANAMFAMTLEPDVWFLEGAKL